MFFEFDLSNFINEQTVCIIVRLSNKLYKKKVEDKKYKEWKKFKNATKAKKFINNLSVRLGLDNFKKDMWLSTRLI